MSESIKDPMYTSPALPNQADPAAILEAMQRAKETGEPGVVETMKLIDAQPSATPADAAHAARGYVASRAETLSQYGCRPGDQLPRGPIAMWPATRNVRRERLDLAERAYKAAFRECWRRIVRGQKTGDDLLLFHNYGARSWDVRVMSFFGLVRFGLAQLRQASRLSLLGR